MKDTANHFTCISFEHSFCSQRSNRSRSSGPSCRWQCCWVRTHFPHMQYIVVLQVAKWSLLFSCWNTNGVVEEY